LLAILGSWNRKRTNIFTAKEFTGEWMDSPEDKLEWIPNENVRDLNLWESDHIFML
jgi:hypothetical protein